jgi:ubiquinone/menaquinone biosynthesis C-methylase UbiE
VRPGGTVVDVAAGTGKLTSLLVARGFEVIAVEPVAEMRAVLQARVSGAEVREGTAEAIPVDDGTAAAVTVAQAFHWFDPDRALAEIARVLTEDGALLIFANVRDKQNELQAELEQLMSPHRGTYPNPTWNETLPDNGLFEPKLRTFTHEQLVDRDTFVERVASVSWIASLPNDVRTSVLAAARGLADRYSEPISLPYVTQVFVCRRR